MRDFSNLDDRRLFEGIKDTFRSYIRRYACSSSCFPFYNEILNRLRLSLLKDTYIDALDRDIKLEIDSAKGTVSVDITTRISYMSIQEGIPYFQVGPRFETLAQAESYRCVKFLLNDVDLTSQVDIQLRKCTDSNRQLPYIVDVCLPLSWDIKDTRLVYETVHMVPLASFFHAYQLVFPCRCMRVNAVVAGSGTHLYYPLVATFSSYNVHMYEGYASEFRDDVTESISIHNWTLPGSGYVLTLKPKAIVPE